MAEAFSKYTKMIKEYTTEDLEDKTTPTKTDEDWLGQIFNSIEEIKGKIGLGVTDLQKANRDATLGGASLLGRSSR